MATKFHACMSRATMAELSVPTSLHVVVSDVTDRCDLDAIVLLVILVPLKILWLSLLFLLLLLPSLVYLVLPSTMSSIH